MSDQKPDGGPAFPINVHPSQFVESTGMSLRDFFAGQALVGIIEGNAGIGNSQNMVADAYAIADEMLAERAK